MSGEIRELARLLNARAAEVACAFLGEPSRRGRHEWRWGSRGSLCVEVAGPKVGRWYCHERGTGGDILGLIAVEQRGDTRAAIEWARRFLAIPQPIAWKTARGAGVNAKMSEAQNGGNVEQARRIWVDAGPIAGTPVEAYLAARGLPLPKTDALRFHPRTPRTKWGPPLPAMIALMQDPATGQPLGVHRTYLRPDGSDRIRDEYGKMMLGRVGAVMLDRLECGQVLNVAEGIETSLAARQLGGAPVWALTSAGAIRRFRVLPEVQALTIWADSDTSEAGLLAAASCAASWRASGRRVSIVRPKEAGTDWADVVLARRAAE